jgi:amidase
MNITRRLTAGYDAALAQYDLLLMPTTPIKATKLPAPDASREEYVEKAINMIANAAPFDVTPRRWRSPAACRMGSRCR